MIVYIESILYICVLNRIECKKRRREDWRTAIISNNTPLAHYPQINTNTTHTTPHSSESSKSLHTNTIP